jgi:hypothetical protein
MRAENRAGLAEFFAQLAVIVDLAVEDDGEPAVRSSERLCAVLGQINDREAQMTEGYVVLR